MRYFLLRGQGSKHRSGWPSSVGDGIQDAQALSGSFSPGGPKPGCLLLATCQVLLGLSLVSFSGFIVVPHGEEQGQSGRCHLTRTRSSTSYFCKERYIGTQLPHSFPLSSVASLVLPQQDRLTTETTSPLSTE